MATLAKATDAERLPAGKLLAWAGAGVSSGANFIILGYMLPPAGHLQRKLPAGGNLQGHIRPNHRISGTSEQIG